MKESYYFSHDYNSRHDPKMIKLKIKETQFGKGVYWDLIEMLYEQGGYLLLEDIEVYSGDLACPPEQLNRIINDYKLFKKDSEKFWSESVLRRLNERKEKSETQKKNVSERWSKKEEKNNKKIPTSYQTDTKVIPTSYQTDTLKERKEKKGKEIKEKQTKQNNTAFACFDFLNLFFVCLDSEVKICEADYSHLKNSYPNYDVDNHLESYRNYLQKDEAKKPYAKNLLTRIEKNIEKRIEEQKIDIVTVPEKTDEEKEAIRRLDKAHDKISREVEKSKAKIQAIFENSEPV